MRVLFVSKELHMAAGSGVGARMHRDTLYKLVGKENVFIIDMDLLTEPCQSLNYRSYGKYKSKFERIRRNLQLNTLFFSNSIIDEITGIVLNEKIEFVFLDDSTFGKLACAIKKKCPGVKVVSFFHDVKAHLYPIWMKNSRLADKIDSKIGIVNEKISTFAVDKNIVLNSAENKLLKTYYGVEADYLLPVCVEYPENILHDPYPKNGKKRILFVGTSYTPNLNGIRWFYRNVFGKISSKFDFWVVGKGLDCMKKEFSNDKSFHAEGFVESLADYYSFADVIIAPLTGGGGMKIKTAEAISYGKIFVGSTESLHGYYEEMPTAIINKIVFRCDTAEEYLKVFLQLANERIEKKNETLINLYKDKYSPDASYNIMKQILEETTGTKI